MIRILSVGLLARARPGALEIREAGRSHPSIADSARFGAVASAYRARGRLTTAPPIIENDRQANCKRFSVVSFREPSKMKSPDE